MYDFKKIEEESEKVWKKYGKEIKKAVQHDTKKPLFSFLEGPPTANAPPALHHFEVRTYKDIICKFKYMQGFSVPRKGGWDCHGLPVEVQVEKRLKLNSKWLVELERIAQQKNALRGKKSCSILSEMRNAAVKPRSCSWLQGYETGFRLCFIQIKK